jgi:hypothetical protein
MRPHEWISSVLVALVMGGAGLAAEPVCAAPCEDCFLKRTAPAGGWNPYGGGLLHWWNPHCFPCTGGPDDYCRKPLPRVCWPAYPPYFRWAPAETCPSPCKGCRDGKP